MRLERPEPNVVAVRYRPTFVPAFCLLFVVVGLGELLRHLTQGGWDTNAAFGIVVYLLLGGGGFLYSARRDTYHFDGQERVLTWTRKGAFSKTEGRIRFADIVAARVVKGPQCGDTTTRVVLELLGGHPFPLANAYTSDEPKHRAVVEAIQHLMAESGPSVATELHAIEAG